jgi:hypothetical protein
MDEKDLRGMYYPILYYHDVGAQDDPERVDADLIVPICGAVEAGIRP